MLACSFEKVVTRTNLFNQSMFFDKALHVHKLSTVDRLSLSLHPLFAYPMFALVFCLLERCCITERWKKVRGIGEIIERRKLFMCQSMFESFSLIICEEKMKIIHENIYTDRSVLFLYSARQIYQNKRFLFCFF